MKPKILIIELWGIGDFALACPFISAAGQKYEVTLLARRAARDFPREWLGDAEIINFEAPWTRFNGKYRLHTWPWAHLGRVIAGLRRRHFDMAVSVRLDPRDHLLMWLSGARRRLGFPRAGSHRFLTDIINPLRPYMHRYTAWRVLSRQLDIQLPVLRSRHPETDLGSIIIHTGAAQPVRIWPLERYAELVDQLRSAGHEVQVVCDLNQWQWWLDHHEPNVIAPTDLHELFNSLYSARLFIGNDSGPGHVAALLGIPTFTLFGPQLPELFAPVHPMAEWSAGKGCDFKPCFDQCRFSSPRCLVDISLEELLPKVLEFVGKHTRQGRAIECQPC